LQDWINQDEDQRARRGLAVKQKFLPDIVIYRMDEETDQTGIGSLLGNLV
jgi:hypothetical protein